MVFGFVGFWFLVLSVSVSVFGFLGFRFRFRFSVLSVLGFGFRFINSPPVDLSRATRGGAAYSSLTAYMPLVYNVSNRDAAC